MSLDVKERYMDIKSEPMQEEQTYDIPILPTRYVAHFLSFMADRGIGHDILLEGTGLSIEQVRQNDGAVTMSQVMMLLKRAMGLVEDERIPFQFGQELDLSAHGLVGAAMMWQNNYYRLIEMIVEYERVCLPILDLRLNLRGEILDISLEELWDLGDIRSFLVRIYMGSIYELGRHVCDDERDLLLEFDFPSSLAQLDWDRVAPNATLSFNAVSARASLHPNRQILSNLGQELSTLITTQRSRQQAQTEHVQTTTRQVRDQILKNPGPGCTLERVAQQLDMTPRSLRRHLRLEDCSFRDLRNEVRRHYADQYLSDTRLPLSTIAHKLGFSDQASFTRAYRCWTGHTPGEIRRGG